MKKFNHALVNGGSNYDSLKKVIVTPAVYPRLVEFLHFGRRIGSGGRVRRAGIRNVSIQLEAGFSTSGAAMY